MRTDNLQYMKHFKNFLFSYDDLSHREKHDINKKFKKYFFDNLEKTSPDVDKEFVENFLQKKFVASLLDAFKHESNSIGDKLANDIIEKNDMSKETMSDLNDNIILTNSDEFYQNPEYWRRLKKVLQKAGVDEHKERLDRCLEKVENEKQLIEDLQFMKKLNLSMLVHRNVLQKHLQEMADNIKKYVREKQLVTNNEMRGHSLNKISNNIMGTIEHVCEETNRQNLFRDWARIGVLAFHVLDLGIQAMILNIDPDHKVLVEEKKKGGSGLIPMPG